MNPVEPAADLFGAVPPAAPDRYHWGTRGGTAGLERARTGLPWSPAEDLSLFPLVAACRSERAYLRTVRWAVLALQREPRTWDGHVSETTMVKESRSLFERRTVTAVLGGMVPAVPVLANELWTAARGDARTWGTGTLLRSWDNVRSADRIAKIELTLMLNLGTLPAGAAPDDLDAPAPVGAAVSAAMAAFRDAPGPDSWAALWGAVGG